MKRLLAGWVMLGWWGMVGCAAALDAPLKLPFQVESGLPTVKAIVGGKPVNLILDLGGFQGLALKPSVAASTPLSFTGQEVHWRNAEGQDFTSRNFNAHVSVGSLDLSEVAGGELGGNEGFPQDGYLGLGVLRHYLAVFDYPQGELRLYASGLAAAMQAECGSAGKPLDVVNGVSQSEVETDHGKLLFQWDTGSSANVLRPSAVGMSPQQAEKQHSLAFEKFVVGGVDTGHQRIGLRQFVAPDVDGVLGTPFFQTRVICVDVTRQMGAMRQL
ncbi:hypothetical protein [Dyella sp. 20L07]|uniref:hypothetical protein n=1 Tax=Dyella sp. 20L07 TaxID=3384240 RepID=UPI003D2D6C44